MQGPEPGNEEEAAVSYPQPEAHLAIPEPDLSFNSYLPKPSASPRHPGDSARTTVEGERLSAVAAASWLVPIPTSTSRATPQEILIAMMPNAPGPSPP